MRCCLELTLACLAMQFGECALINWFDHSTFCEVHLLISGDVKLICEGASISI